MKEIFERRSIRKFTNEPVSEEHIERLLRAAMQAPSACNEQPWEFVVIKDREVMKEIRAYQHFSMPLDTAGCAVVVCGDTRRQQYKGFWVQDCAAATENLLLEAEYLGLGAVWMGLYPVDRWVEKTREVLNLPEEVVPLGVVALGHPQARVEAQNRFRPERIHRDRW